MFRLADPYYLGLLALVGAVAWMMFRRRAHSALLFAPTHCIPAAHRTWRTMIQACLPWIFLLGLISAVVALARPQTLFSKTLRSSDAIAIQMVVDASGSMEALDFSTEDRYRSRLEVVKETFARFIERRPEDLIGLVTFGGYATTRVPMTVDHDALLLSLKSVQVPKPSFDKEGQIVNQEELMTAIGDALATACSRLEPVDLKSRIIVLLSDGESNTGMIKPDEAIKAVKALGVKIYTIGVGSTGRAPFMGRDVFGRNAIQYAYVKLDEELLRSMATATGGHYFNVRDPKGLERALRDIDRLEKTRIRKETYNQYNELFPWFLVPALACLMMATGLSVAIARRVI